MKVILFENQNTDKMLPMTHTRPVYDILCGGRRQWERVIETFGSQNVSLLTRNHLKNIINTKTGLSVNKIPDDECIFLDGSVLFSREKMKKLSYDLNIGEVVVQDEIIIALKPEINSYKEIVNKIITGEKIDLRTMKKIEISPIPSLVHPWDIVYNNGLMIKMDFNELQNNFNIFKTQRDLAYTQEKTIDTQRIFDQSKGPIVLEGKIDIKSPGRIEGPTWIRDGCEIRSGIIGQNTSIGERCKIGGEIEISVVEGYSNKAHEGYIGHSYVGEWVNIGALSVISNLKNTYGNIKMNINHKKINTNLEKLGTFIGDNAKISVGSIIYSGLKIGVGSHIHGYVVKDVPSFCIYMNSITGKSVALELESAIRTQSRMFLRRGIEHDEIHSDILKHVYLITEKERKDKGILKEKLVM